MKTIFTKVEFLFLSLPTATLLSLLCCALKNSPIYSCIIGYTILEVTNTRNSGFVLPHEMILKI